MKTVYTLAAAFLFILVFVAGGFTAEQVHVWSEDSNCINADCTIPCEQVKQFKRHQGCKK